MIIRAFVFLAGFVMAAQAHGATNEERARAMAECGYLTAVVADQVRKTSPEYDVLVREVVDFTNLFFAFSGKQVSSTSRVTLAMLSHMTEIGYLVHERRLTAISERNAIRLSNRILQDCRTDLQLLGRKYATEAGIAAQGQ